MARYAFALVGAICIGLVVMLEWLAEGDALRKHECRPDEDDPDDAADS